MNSFLIDGPLMEASARRQAVLERMAKDLAESGDGLLCDSDAMKVLRHKGYPMVDVALLAPEARMVAMRMIAVLTIATRWKK